MAAFCSSVSFCSTMPASASFFLSRSIASSYALLGAPSDMVSCYLANRPQVLRQQHDADVPAPAAVLLLRDSDGSAIVRPRGQREVSLQDARGVVAVGV